MRVAGREVVVGRERTRTWLLRGRGGTAGGCSLGSAQDHGLLIGGNDLGPGKDLWTKAVMEDGTWEPLSVICFRVRPSSYQNFISLWFWREKLKQVLFDLENHEPSCYLFLEHPRISSPVNCSIHTDLFPGVSCSSCGFWAPECKMGSGAWVWGVWSHLGWWAVSQLWVSEQEPLPSQHSSHSHSSLESWDPATQRKGVE